MLVVYLHHRNKQIEIMTTQMQAFNQVNPVITEVKKDGLTLEIRERGYFIILSNGKITKKGIRLNQELKTYFGV
jgi:hypothetical protein